MKRVIFDIVLLISVFVFPWWISTFLLLIGIFLFNNFYEFIITNVIIYSLYAVKGDRWITSPIFFSMIIIILYIIIQIIRNNIILYKK
jgi:energy-coupling factor transporter transmembrane protein EcfT